MPEHLPLRIRRLELQNFKGFAGRHAISFGDNGQNLVVYGENGTGKTSIVKALEGLFKASRQSVVFQRNLFCEPSATAQVVLHFNDGQQYVWLEGQLTTDAPDLRIANSAKAMRVLDYKSLLQTYFLQNDTPAVNVFSLLVNDILADVQYGPEDKAFRSGWEAIKLKPPLDRRKPREIKVLNEDITTFNSGLKKKLLSLSAKANEILQVFGDHLGFELEFYGISYVKPTNSLIGDEIIIKTRYQERVLENHHLVLNEAKLSAIAISLFMAAALETPHPTSGVSLIVLDDVLIGLDMEHRRPILNALRRYFGQYQIVMLTYDKTWFEIVKGEFDTTPDWSFLRISRPNSNIDQVTIVGEGDYLSQARQHLNQGDLHAAANYARSAVEKCLQHFCDSNRVKLPFKRNLSSLNSEHFLNGIIDWQQGMRTVINPQLEKDLRAVRRLVLNPLSHGSGLDLQSTEVAHAIQVVQRLQDALRLGT